MTNTLHPRTLILLLSSIALMSLPHVLHVPAPIMAFFFGLLIWRFTAIWKPHYLPSPIIVFCLLLTGIGLLVFMHSGVFGRDAGTMVFITALGLKLLEIQTQRDLYLISFLAFIVAASQFLYLQNIFMAGYILMVSISLFATLLSINSGTLNNKQALKKSAIILMQAIPLMIVIFIFFPRVELPRWSFLDDDNKATSGLSDSLEPGSISQLGLSGEIVFRAKFTGKIPTPEQRYWRGPVFSYTDGKRWSPSKNTYFKRYLDKISFKGEKYQYKLLMEPQSKNWVYALDMPAQYPYYLRTNTVHQLITKQAFNKRAEYDISSYAEYNTGYLTKTEYKDNLQLRPKASERIKALVKQLGGFDGKAETYINNIFKHFHQNEFHYTLFPPLLNDNPIEDFLFNSKAGFCGHYATAFTYLMRAANIPTRIVTGYQGGLYNESGDFIEVRQANAHAWAEVWLKGKGWVRFDPTTAVAPDRVENDVNIEQQISQQTISFAPVKLDSQTISFLKSARQLWSSVDYSWQRWIINYTRKNQLNFLAGLGIKSLTAMLYWLIGSAIVISLIIGLYVLRKQKPKLTPAQRYYAKACHKLAPFDLIKQPSEGEHDFLQRVSKEQPQFAVAFQTITQLYSQLRYERQGHNLELLQRLKQAVNQLHIKHKH